MILKIKLYYCRLMHAMHTHMRMHIINIVSKKIIEVAYKILGNINYMLNTAGT